MPSIISRIKEWSDGEILTAADLNAEFDNLVDNLIPASIDDYSENVAQMQLNTTPGGLGTESLATTLGGELERLRFVIKRIINQAQWYIAPVGSLSTGGIDTASLADGAVETAKLNDLAVTPGKLADGAATPVKMGANLTEVTSSSGSYSTSSSTFQDPTNMSRAITTTGRSVLVYLEGEASTDSYIGLLNGAAVSESNINMSGNIQILRGASVIYSTQINFQGRTDSTGTAFLTIPPSSIFVVDPNPAAASITYKVQVAVDALSTASTEIHVTNCLLRVVQL